MSNGIAAAALAMSASNSAKASRLERELEIAECKTWIDTFDPATATLELKQQYAECIRKVHPVVTDMPIEVVYVLKFLFVAGLIGFMWRMWSEFGSYYSDWAMAFIEGILLFFAIPLAISLIGTMGVGVIWLFM